MSDDMRNEIRRLLDESSYNHVELINEIKNRYGYRLSKPEFSVYLSCTNTPKAQKVLTAALTILTEEQMRRKALLEAARRV